MRLEGFMTNILLITHNHVGTALLATAKRTIEEFPCEIKAISIPQDANLDISITQIHTTLAALDNGNGVLILTDMYGSTPSNVANHLLEESPIQVKIISGLNLPMLLRAINYAQLPLANLAEKAFLGGRDGVCISTRKDKQQFKASYDSKICHDNQ